MVCVDIGSNTRSPGSALRTSPTSLFEWRSHRGDLPKVELGERKTLIKTESSSGGVIEHSSEGANGTNSPAAGSQQAFRIASVPAQSSTEDSWSSLDTERPLLTVGNAHTLFDNEVAVDGSFVSDRSGTENCDRFLLDFVLPCEAGEDYARCLDDESTLGTRRDYEYNSSSGQHASPVSMVKAVIGEREADCSGAADTEQATTAPVAMDITNSGGGNESPLLTAHTAIEAQCADVMYAGPSCGGLGQAEERCARATHATSDAQMRHEEHNTYEWLARMKPKLKRRAARFDKPVASRFCHVCSRTPKRVRLAVCSKIRKGTCRKVICERCFGLYKYGNFEQAYEQPSSWICTHCTGQCPPKAQCRTYQRINEQLRLLRLRKDSINMMHRDKWTGL